MAIVIVKNSMDANGLLEAAKNGGVSVVKKLLKRKVDPNSCDVGGRTTLLWAAMEGHLDIARMLIDSGADVNRAAVMAILLC